MEHADVLEGTLSSTSANGCMVVFCGLPGAGKTTLCNKVAARITSSAGLSARIVSFDAVYHARVDALGGRSTSDGPEEFDPSVWRSCREETFATIKPLLSRGSGGSPSVLILDDNMYLQSMRKYCYKLARDGNFAFVVVHLAAPPKDCWARNCQRKGRDVVPSHVFERMAVAFEDPVTGTHSWSSNVVSIADTLDARSCADVIRGVTQALRTYHTPPKPRSVSFPSGATTQEAPLRHQLDLRLREVISSRIRTARDAGSTKLELSDLARVLSSSKSALLSSVKTLEDGGPVEYALSLCFSTDDLQNTLHALVEYFQRTASPPAPPLIELGELTVNADGELDVVWLGARIARRVVSAQIKDLEDKIGGMCGELYQVDAQCDDESLSLVLKTGRACWVERDKLLGTAREALFLSRFSSRLDGMVPRVYYAYGDMGSGAKAVLMERLPNAVPAGVFYGPGNPANWKIIDALDTMCEGNPGTIPAAKLQFELYAKMHAMFWRDRSLLSLSWLRASQWMQGRERHSWEKTQRLAVNMWSEYKQRASDEEDVPLKVHPHTLAAIESSHSKICWDAHLAEANSRAWTLVHGDCHPHNALWINQRTPDARICLIDFEMVGVGSPPQDLGQFLISHVDPALRLVHERELLTHYHDALTYHLRECGHHEAANEYLFKDCWEEYVTGAAGRWLWFVPHLCSGTTLSDEMTQFFHDQLTAFLLAHFPDPTTVPMPRV